MDDKRFDHISKLLGAGASRRSLIKAFLGIGGTGTAAVLEGESADARTRRPRPAITTSPPPVCPPGHQFCGGEGAEYCCPGGRCFDGMCCAAEGTERCGERCCPAGQCTSSGTCCETGYPCGTVCCPAGSECGRSGNSDICCGGPAGGAPCGLDCCDDPLKCCDAECCGDGAVCLTRVFGGYEELCCPAGQTCDGQCCQGTCFTPLGTSVGGFDRSCCPPESNLCPGIDTFAGVALCCQGGTPDCCANTDGSPICLTEEQCCTSAECAHLTDPARCLIGVCDDFSCQSESICTNDEHCCTGGDGICCPESQTCCGPVCCDAGLSCCEREVAGTLTSICYDPTAQNACCEDSECPDNPATCEVGVCLADQTCGFRSTCEDGEKCCEGSSGVAGFCRDEALCCDDGDCPDDPANCGIGECESDGCQTYTTCEDGERCCAGDAETAGVCAASDGCCDAGDCSANERCANHRCTCLHPYMELADGRCVQCDSEDEEGHERCWRFGIHEECAACVDNFCTPDVNGTECEIEPSETQGYCLRATGSCVPCLIDGYVCTGDYQCCGDTTCGDGICGGEPADTDTGCDGVSCGTNEDCYEGQCECRYPYLERSDGACVQCLDDNDVNCERFGMNRECADCIDNVCMPGEDDVDDECYLNEEEDQGYCLGNTGICVACLYFGSVCTHSNQCCDYSVECIDGICGGPPECGENDDCGECEFCSEERRCEPSCAECEQCVADQCIDPCTEQNECMVCSDQTGTCEPKRDNLACSDGVCCHGTCIEDTVCAECEEHSDCPGTAEGGCFRCEGRLCRPSNDACPDLPCHRRFCSFSGNCEQESCDCDVGATVFGLFVPCCGEHAVTAGCSACQNSTCEVPD